MIRHHKSIFLAVAALCTPAAAQVPPSDAMAMHHTEVCAAPAPLPAPLAGWAAPHLTMNAARKAGQLAHATLTLGQAADATLPHTPEVAYVVQPLKPGGTVSYGGIFAFEVPAAGTYRVALDSHSWTDVIEDGASLASIAHGHGPACTGVAKMVDYTLKPGRHLLQISAQGEPKLTLMVTRLP